MAQLFCKDRTVIGRHIRNAISEGEIDPVIMCAKYAHMGKEGNQMYNVDIYNLDVVIFVGYCVKSQRGVEFRRWATSVLKEPRFLRRQQAHRRRFVSVFSEAQQVATPQRRVEAHRRPHACRAHGDDRLLQTGRKRAHG
jgi:hypothetical protein